MHDPLTHDPMAWFDRWMKDAEATKMVDPNAMCLSTVGADGMPSSRMVLLKERSSQGFVFYTNLQSRKGRELTHGKAALLFYWRELGRQIRIEGRLEPVLDEIADQYFASRPRGSQVGAWASLQSQPLESKEILSARIMEVEELYGENPIPRPPHWSGTEVIAERIEFWQAGEFRLHDRFEFSAESGRWNPPKRLFP